MVSHRCHKCAWFDREHHTLREIPANLGYCRKHKPVIYPQGRLYYGAWPLVDREDLCGEFREDVNGLSD